MIEHDPPTTIQECDERMEVARDAIADIKTQLHADATIGPNGKFPTAIAYSAWRKRATAALMNFERDLSLLKRRRKLLYDQRPRDAILAYFGGEPTDADLLAALWRIVQGTRAIRELKVEGAVDGACEAILDEVRRRMQRRHDTGQPV